MITAERTLDHYRRLPLDKQGVEFDRVWGALRRRTADEIVMLGEMLAFSRDVIPHGGWLKWLKDRGLADRTAQRWIALAQLVKDGTISRSWLQGKSQAQCLRHPDVAKSANLADLEDDEEEPEPIKPDPDAKPTQVSKLTVADLERKVQSLRDRNRQLEALVPKPDVKRRAAGPLEMLTKENERLEQDNKTLERLMHGVSKAENQDHKVQMAQNEIVRMRTELDKMVGENMGLSDRVAELERDIEALEAKVAELEAENGTLRAAVVVGGKDEDAEGGS